MMNHNEVIAVAATYGLRPELVLAIIQVESSGDPNAWRVEPHYRYLWHVVRNQPFRSLTLSEMNNERAPSDFPSLTGSRNTEWLGQQASWGPMQIMGAVAREHGFTRMFPELCGILGVDYGCKHLAQLMRRFRKQHGVEGVIAAYNAGSPRIRDGLFVNQDYVNKVVGLMDSLKT